MTLQQHDEENLSGNALVVAPKGIPPSFYIVLAEGDGGRRGKAMKKGEIGEKVRFVLHALRGGLIRPTL